MGMQCAASGASAALLGPSEGRGPGTEYELGFCSLEYLGFEF